MARKGRLKSASAAANVEYKYPTHGHSKRSTHGKQRPSEKAPARRQMSNTSIRPTATANLASVGTISFVKTKRNRTHGAWHAKAV